MLQCQFVNGPKFIQTLGIIIDYNLSRSIKQQFKLSHIR